ncbi:MAG TPA: xyloglucanase [Pyrinomonadaceae bacterium]|nr:xyloglucanase [Pyrinomonadaceae bacterium]
MNKRRKLFNSSFIILHSAFLLLSIPLLIRPASARAAAGPYRWRSVVIVGGGFVTGLITHPTQRGLIYARTDVGGAYRRDSPAGEWIPITDMIGMSDWHLTGIESLAVDPSRPNRVYLAAGIYTNPRVREGAVLRSEDGGRTWRRTDMPFKMGGNEAGRANGERLAVDPNDGDVLFFGSRRDGLWRSADRGATWKKVESFPSNFEHGVDIGESGPVPYERQAVGIVFVQFDARGGTRGQPTQTIYLGVSTPDTSLYRSTDGGKSWAHVHDQPEGLRPNHAALASDGMLYLTYGREPGPNTMTDGAVWRYDTRKNIWANITPIKPGAGDRFGYGGVSVDARRPRTLVVVTFARWDRGDEIFRSTDGGEHWTAVGPKAVRTAHDARWLYWHRAEPSATGWMGDVEIDPFDSDRVLYVTGQGVWESNDVTAADRGKRTHWAFSSRGLEETVALDLISPPAGAHLVSGVGDIGGFRHDRLDVSPPEGMFSNPIFANTESLDFAERDPSFIVRTGTSQHGRERGQRRGAYSLDGAKSWTPFAAEPDGDGAGTVAVSADGRTIVWTPRGGVAHYSRDRGATWRQAAGLSTRMPVVSDRVNPNKFYAYDLRRGQVYASTDGGETFSVRAGNLPAGYVTLRAAPGFEGELWLSSGSGARHTAGSGLYRSTDSGQSFVRVKSIAEVYALGFGKAAPGRRYPAVYVAGKVGTVQGLFRSDDTGQTWTRINDDRHQFGQINVITGDPRIYGRVYIGTGGRGILYGEPVN